MIMSRAWAMPSADTFDVEPIGLLVRRYLHGVSVDPFARNKRWATHTNDLNPNTEAEHHMDACSFMETLARDGVVADTIILDPPYSPRQVTEYYADAGIKANAIDTSANFGTRIRASARLLCARGTTVMTFGWNSCGMGKGFDGIELLLVAHGGSHNDTICFVEKMTQEQTELFERSSA